MKSVAFTYPSPLRPSFPALISVASLPYSASLVLPPCCWSCLPYPAPKHRVQCSAFRPHLQLWRNTGCWDRRAVWGQSICYWLPVPPTPPQILTLKLIPYVRVFGDEALGKRLSHEGRALIDGISVLTKEVPKRSLASSAACYSKRRAG